MTAIAAVVDKGKVWMGGDSAVLFGFNLELTNQPKVFRKGEFLVGLSGDFRMLQLVRYAFEPPLISEGEDLEHYFATSFVNTLRDCLKGAGFAEKDKEKESTDGCFLVGVRGRIFAIWSSYAFSEVPYDYAAVGCGDSFAKGVFYATRGKPPKQRIQLALEAAERHSAGVRGPFVILGPEKR